MLIFFLNIFDSIGPKEFEKADFNSEHIPQRLSALQRMITASVICAGKEHGFTHVLNVIKEQIAPKMRDPES